MTTRLKRVRREHGLSQQRLADLSGCTRVTIANYESGTTKEGRPSIRARIERVLGVPIETLLLPENDEGSTGVEPSSSRHAVTPSPALQSKKGGGS